MIKLVNKQKWYTFSNISKLHSHWSCPYCLHASQQQQQQSHPSFPAWAASSASQVHDHLRLLLRHRFLPTTNDTPGETGSLNRAPFSPLAVRLFGWRWTFPFAHLLYPLMGLSNEWCGCKQTSLPVGAAFRAFRRQQHQWYTSIGKKSEKTIMRCCEILLKFNHSVKEFKCLERHSMLLSLKWSRIGVNKKRIKSNVVGVCGLRAD